MHERYTTVASLLVLAGLIIGITGCGSGTVPPPVEVTRATESTLYGFDNGGMNEFPEQFVAARTGPGEDGTWAVLADPTAPSAPYVLAQTSTDATSGRFPMAIADPAGKYKDLEVSVKFKAISGSVDQAGGLVFRYQDPDNYYVVRANALENNYRLYRVVDGRRQQFAGSNVKVKHGVWHNLTVVAVGDRIEASFDGQKLIDAQDDTFQTSGLVGVWTKADSVTNFDDLEVREVQLAPSS